MGFSGIAARAAINKEDTVITNNRLEKYCQGNEFFFIDNSNIWWNLLQQKQIASKWESYTDYTESYLASNVRKHIFNIEWNHYDSLNREKTLLCTSPMFGATDNDSETALRLSRSKNF